MDSRAELQVVHSLPGRLRLRVLNAVAAVDLAAYRDRFLAIPGVQSVDINPVSRSLLVRYDPSQFDPGGHVSLVPVTHAPLEHPPQRIDRAPSSEIAQSLSQWFWRTDAEIHEATGGKADLKLLVPASLMLAGLVELVGGAALAGATMHTLAWYAYNMFYQMHPREMQSRA